MKKILLLFILLIAFSFKNDVKASEKEKASMAINAKEIKVLLWVKDKKFIKKMKKKGKTEILTKYNNFIDSLNYVTKSISKYWFKDKNVTFNFGYGDETEKLSVPEGTIIMYIKYTTLGIGRLFPTNSKGSALFRNIINLEKEQEFSATPSLVVAITDSKGRVIPISLEPFANIKIRKIDLKAATLLLKYHLIKKAMSKSERKIEKKRNQDFSVLQEKTLYISQKDIYKDLNEKDIKAIYPFKIEIIKSNKEFEKLILEETNGYFLIPKKVQLFYLHHIYDFSNENVLTYVPFFMRGNRAEYLFLSRTSLKMLMKKINK